MAAAAWVGLPPHCSHSNFFFADVDISTVLATFFAGGKPNGLNLPGQALLSALTPTVRDLFGELKLRLSLRLG